MSSHLVECTCKEDTALIVTRLIIANSPYFKKLIMNITNGPLEKKTLADIQQAVLQSHPGINNVSESYLYQHKRAVLNFFILTERSDRYVLGYLHFKMI